MEEFSHQYVVFVSNLSVHGTEPEVEKQIHYNQYANSNAIRYV